MLHLFRDVKEFGVAEIEILIQRLAIYGPNPYLVPIIVLYWSVGGRMKDEHVSLFVRSVWSLEGMLDPRTISQDLLMDVLSAVLTLERRYGRLLRMRLRDVVSILSLDNARVFDRSLADVVRMIKKSIIRYLEYLVSFEDNSRIYPLILRYFRGLSDTEAIKVPENRTAPL